MERFRDALSKTLAAAPDESEIPDFELRAVGSGLRGYRLYRRDGRFVSLLPRDDSDVCTGNTHGSPVSCIQWPDSFGCASTDITCD